ncbi:hypothetical protein P0Y43_20600 [Pseudomonas entomophila]|uniref:hypothetical protein n=1 Tax=Pseudomonas entomophila TaxID=312306 RepID=UPI0023D825B9|nr:hypothetical protein [Pseudomonas entomophila]MDF0733097.1 hypothetical protein [Pseudomonas entomophila]
MNDVTGKRWHSGAPGVRQAPATRAGSGIDGMALTFVVVLPMGEIWDYLRELSINFSREKSTKNRHAKVIFIGSNLLFKEFF